MKSTIEEVLKEHAQVDKQYEAKIKIFRPLFGNTKHIALCDFIEEINTLEKKGRAIVAARRGGQTAYRELIRLKKLALCLFEE